MLSLGLVGSLFANNLYIGGGVGISKGTETIKYNSNTASTDYNTKNFYIKFGSIFYNGNRLEFSFNSIKTDFNNNDTYTGIDMDYLFTFSQKATLNPYIGIGVGWYRSSEKEGFYINTGKKDNASAASINLSAGLLFAIGS